MFLGQKSLQFISFPTQVIVGFAMRPRAWVALLLALLAALAHLISVIALLNP
jgi:hypothetical protein